MAVASKALGAGFGELPLDAARTYRAILNATAWPGRIMPMSPVTDPPKPLSAVAADLFLTLVDFDTPVWLDEAAAQPDVYDYLRFHAGCPLVDEPLHASFALVADPAHMPGLSEFAQGTAEYPDRSTTVIVQTGMLSNRDDVVFTGPGIEHEQRFSADGISGEVWRDIQANHRGFPLGVDLIFVGSVSIAACPRSVSIALTREI